MVTPPTPARLEALRALLDDPSPVVREAVVAELRGMGESGLLFLKRVCEGPDAELAGIARGHLRVLGPVDPVQQFDRFIRSQRYELESGCILLARTARPDLDPAEVCGELDRLAARIRSRLGEDASALQRFQALARFLLREVGFQGDGETYADPRNSFIDQVLARRRGLPITLSIVCVLVAERLGLDLHVVALPGHCIVGSFQPAENHFLDPFHGGDLLSELDLLDWLQRNRIDPVSSLHPAPAREVLCRCCRNLAHHCKLAGLEEAAARYAGFVEAFEAVRSEG